MTHKITFSADVIKNATIEEINHISERLHNHFKNNDLMNSASSMTYNVDGFDTILEITL